MNVNAEEVAQPVWHEHRPQMNLHHVVHGAMEDANFFELLQVDPVSQTVHIRPGDPWEKAGGDCQ